MSLPVVSLDTSRPRSYAAAAYRRLLRDVYRNLPAWIPGDNPPLMGVRLESTQANALSTFGGAFYVV